MMDQKLKDDAAFAAHMKVVSILERELGRKPETPEIACVLAQSFGDALAIAGAWTESEALVMDINAIAQDAYVKTLKHIRHEFGVEVH